MSYTYYGNELYHHGILGQKWGVRRFQNPDGTRTAAGKKREKTSGSKRRIKVEDAEKDPYVKSQIKGHRNKLIEKYKKQGMSQAEAEAAADRRIATEKKVVIGVGAAAATALVVGFAIHNRKIYEDTLKDLMGDAAEDIINSKESIAVDKKIAEFTSMKIDGVDARELTKTGREYLQDTNIDFSKTPLHRVVNQGERVTGDHAVYMSFGSDSEKYKALYAKQLTKTNRTPVELTINAKAPVKLAGIDSCKKEFLNKIENDKDFLNNVIETNKANVNNQWLRMIIPERAALHEAANRRLELVKMGYPLSENDISGKDLDTCYKAFNINLVQHRSTEARAASKSFYDALKSKGFHAIEDVNDKDYSGYKSKHPLIVFDFSALDLENQKSEAINLRTLDDEVNRVHRKMIIED